MSATATNIPRVLLLYSLMTSHRLLRDPSPWPRACDWSNFPTLLQNLRKVRLLSGMFSNCVEILAGVYPDEFQRQFGAASVSLSLRWINLSNDPHLAVVQILGVDSILSAFHPPLISMVHLGHRFLGHRTEYWFPRNVGGFGG